MKTNEAKNMKQLITLNEKIEDKEWQNILDDLILKYQNINLINNVYELKYQETHITFEIVEKLANDKYKINVLYNVNTDDYIVKQIVKENLNLLTIDKFCKLIGKVNNDASR